MLQTINPTKKANKSAKTEITMSLSHLSTKSVTAKTESALTTARRNVVKETNNEVRSISSYFREFRKTFKNIEIYLNEAHKKGRTFNAELIQDILMVGNIKPIIEADERLQARKETEARAKGKKFTAPLLWSGDRIFTAFILAVETTAPKTK